MNSNHPNNQWGWGEYRGWQQEGIYDNSLTSQQDVLTLPQLLNTPHLNDRMVSGAPALSYEQQVELFYGAQNLPCSYTGPMIPQQMYTPPTRRDQDRYVAEAELSDPVYFWRGSSCGFMVQDMLKGGVNDLENSNRHVLGDVSQSASIRIQWPGYRSWSKQISTLNFRKERQPITGSKLAQLVSKKVQEFFNECEAEQGNYGTMFPNHPDASRWKIGHDHIGYEDVVVVSLHHVSKGSWQPTLRLRK